MIYRRSYLGPLLLVLLLAPGSVARAQFMKGETVLSGGGGLLFPTGVFSDASKQGYGFQASAERVLNPSWALGVRLSFATFDAEGEATAATGLLRTRYLAIDTYGKLFLYPESWFTPYALAGFGIYPERRWSRGASADQVDDASRLGFIGGFGLSAHRQAGRTSFFTQVIYHHLPTDAQSKQFVEWAAGLRFSFGGRPF